ncbi:MULTISPECIES: AIPR family protein [Rhodococcus]|uniref:AIPR protein n=1 Tax=Rhodococcus jostii TaxID=132919 RepID=A0A1H4JCG2_RHOJO|nr:MULTISPECIES: AIPR family protein [Rhodococcus]MDJ0418874.1 AIPR family protein [Rhodococcus opacus]SEB43268.1 AIPR protein [Rhodococcus jostii]
MTAEPTPDQNSTDAPAPTQLNEGPGWIALSQRDDLAKYGEGNSIALFAAELKLGLDDVGTFAADALTDGNNDKKCDLVSVDRASGQLVIAQAYATKKPEKKTEAPSGKTSDLNAAVTWLLTGDIVGMPETLRSAALEARDALDNGEITDLQIWSVHNCPESKNVSDELDQVVKTADSIVRRHWPTLQINVSAAEIGKSTINDLYARASLPIAVEDVLEFDTLGGYLLAGEKWQAYNTAVRLSQLRDLWKKYDTDLMSPNVRDYLGIRRSERNINYGIKNTAKNTPGDFFIYNNGITAVVHRFTEPEDGQQKITVEGLGIVNGGQTTGAIGTLNNSEISGLSDSWVQIRFVTSENSEILENVVKYNNTQNKIEATDFRSRDEVQERLRDEFKSVPEALYRGARRGGANDAIKRDRTLLADSTVAQSIAAFHGFPNLAYNELRQIWEQDSTYSKFFNENLSARHIVLCYSLLKEIENQKAELNLVPEDKRTKPQRARAEFFRSRGGIHLLAAAIGNCIETLLDKPVPNLFLLQFKDNPSPYTAMSHWRPIVQTCAAFTSQLRPATDLGIKSADRVSEAVSTFGSMIEATRDNIESSFIQFADQVEFSR